MYKRIFAIFLSISLLCLSACGSSDEKKVVEKPIQIVKELPNGLAITDYRESSDGTFSVTLNGAIAFKDLKIRERSRNRGPGLFFPEAPSKSGGNSFDIVRFKNKNIPIAMKQVLLEQRTMGSGKPEDLKITDVNVRKMEKMGSLKAFIDITINDMIMVSGLKVLDGKNGLWVAWPSRKVGDKYIDLVHPIDKDARKYTIDAIIAAYEAAE